jgi:predicted ester cyclase
VWRASALLARVKDPYSGKERSRSISAEENKAIVHRQEEELFTQGNLDAADEIYAPNYVGHDPSNPEDIRGLEAAKQAASDYRKAFPDLQVIIEDLIAEGDRVAARVRFRGTHQGSWKASLRRAGGWSQLELS